MTEIERLKEEVAELLDMNSDRNALEQDRDECRNSMNFYAREVKRLRTAISAEIGWHNSVAGRFLRLADEYPHKEDKYLSAADSHFAAALRLHAILYPAKEAAE